MSVVCILSSRLLREMLNRTSPRVDLALHHLLTPFQVEYSPVSCVPVSPTKQLVFYWLSSHPDSDLLTCILLAAIKANEIYVPRASHCITRGSEVKNPY